MSNIEKIRQEIERRKKVYLTKNGFPKGTFGAIKIETYEGLLAFIDSLPEENNPEPYNPVYDEDYLNGKIAKAKKSWEGVDVDKFMDEVRGRDEEPIKDLEEEIQGMYQAIFGTDIINRREMVYLETFDMIARHFAEWGAKHLK